MDLPRYCLTLSNGGHFLLPNNRNHLREIRVHILNRLGYNTTMHIRLNLSPINGVEAPKMKGQTTVYCLTFTNSCWNQGGSCHLLEIRSAPD